MDGMITAALLGVTWLIGCTGLAVFIKLLVDRKQAEIEARISAVLEDFTTAPEGDTLSPLAQYAELIGLKVGSSAAKSLTAILATDAGHVQRQLNELETSVAIEGIGASNPAIAAILNMPSVQKLIRKNPSALQALPLLIDKLGIGGKHQGNGNEASPAPKKMSMEL